MPLSDPNDGIECDEWYREAGLFRPLCGQQFYPAVSDNTCDVCIDPIFKAPEYTCPWEFLADSPGQLIRAPSNLNIEFQTGDLEFRESYVCNRTVNVGGFGKSLIPELVGQTVAFPCIVSEDYRQIWQTDWIPVGSRFASYKKINFSDGATLAFYRQDWDVDIRITMTVGGGSFPSRCNFRLNYEAKRKNNTSSGTPFGGLSGGQGAGGDFCGGWQVAGYSWGIPNNTIQELRSYHSFVEDYRIDTPAVPGSPYGTKLLALNTDVNRALPVFRWRFASIGCAWHNLSVINSIEEEAICEGSTCRGWSSKTYPRYTQGLTDREGCTFTGYPAWTPGILTFRMFEL